MTATILKIVHDYSVRVYLSSDIAIKYKMNNGNVGEYKFEKNYDPYVSISKDTPILTARGWVKARDLESLDVLVESEDEIGSNVSLDDSFVI